MAGGPLEKECTLEETYTWVVAVLCAVLVRISILIEHGIHLLEKLLNKKREVSLVETLEKVKSELTLLGFVSQNTISNICVPKKIASSWRRCNKPLSTGKSCRRLLEFSDCIICRSLATKGYDKCSTKGQHEFVTAYGIHQLHIFIIVLAIIHVLFSLAMMTLLSIKMRRWKSWENETKTRVQELPR